MWVSGLLAFDNTTEGKEFYVNRTVREWLIEGWLSESLERLVALLDLAEDLGLDLDITFPEEYMDGVFAIYKVKLT